MTGNRILIWVVGVIVVLVVVTGAFFIMKRNKTVQGDGDATKNSQSKVTSTEGLDPWGDKCQIKETGRKELTASPIKTEQLATVAPMGLTAGGHVTPIDHMYFYPVETPGNRFSASVYAVGDGIITSVQHRGDITDGPATLTPGQDEYRLTIEQTCNQGYYYDLITKLAPALKEKVGTLKGGDGKALSYPVKAGDLIGYVGNQSLDFGVYDTTVTLGFIVPSHYQAEPWKIHTADAFSYFTKEAYAVFEPKIMRAAEPRAGKIDYDKDGYLIGNWFEVGTNGYAGKDPQNHMGYWDGHLAILYDAYDPKLISISMGRFKGNDPQAFFVKGNTPDPGIITPDSGLIKYELMEHADYKLPNGSSWDHKTAPGGALTGTPGGKSMGTVLMQMTGARALKMEVFPDKVPADVTAFTSAARSYER
jgi:hypothetical protein